MRLSAGVAGAKPPREGGAKADLNSAMARKGRKGRRRPEPGEDYREVMSRGREGAAASTILGAQRLERRASRTGESRAAGAGGDLPPLR